MKKSLLTILIAAAALSASADWTGNGYYRIRNHESGRTAFLLDNNASVNKATQTADVSAIQLWNPAEKALSDASTILYITHINGTEYDIKAQGSSIYQMISRYINLSLYKGYYLAYGKDSGFSLYLGDPDPWGTDSTTMSTSGSISTEYRMWELLPLNNTDNYFGIQSTVKAGNEYYAPMYCDFPFTTGNGMAAYYVTKVDSRRGVAVYKQVTDNKVYNAVPVFIKCTSNNPADNKVTVGGSASAPTNNILKGAYFDSNRYGHVSYTPNNKETMRYLGLTSEGKLGYVTIDAEAAPRNASYLPVSAGTPDELTLVTEEEYQEICAANILPDEVVLNKTTLELTIGETEQLIATVTPDNTTNSSITWTSSNPFVATVDDNGVVTAVSPGEFTIQAVCVDRYDMCHGVVKKYDQVITWAQEFGEILDTDVIELTAIASSELPVSYEIIKGEGSINGSQLTFKDGGEFIIVASQEGNDLYAAAESVTKSFNVTAGIADVVAEGFSLAGRIINNANGLAYQVYNTQGVQIYKGSQSIELSRGLYIVRTQSATFKVVIR